MDVGLADHAESIPAIKCTDRISLEILQSDGQSLLVRQGEAVLEHPGSDPFALVSGEQMEFTKASVIAGRHDGNSSDGALIVHDFEEWFLGKTRFVRLQLVRFVPSPSVHNIWPQRGSLRIEGKTKSFVVVRQHIELNVGRQTGELHGQLIALGRAAAHFHQARSASTAKVREQN